MNEEFRMATENHKRIQITGTGIPVPGNDIDTDRIIPARYLKCVSFDGLEAHAFHDERFEFDGSRKQHPFNDNRYAGASILIVNKNFGCGSSREHAPQSLVRFGINGIIGESFAEIFSGNCTALGVPAVTSSQECIQKLMHMAQTHPQTRITIDLKRMRVTCDRETCPIDMPEASRASLIEGTWDTTTQLLNNLEAINKTAKALPYLHV